MKNGPNNKRDRDNSGKCLVFNVDLKIAVKTTCRICGADILQTTANATDNRCMPCWKDPGRIERKEKTAKAYTEERERLRRDKRIVREFSKEPFDDPHTILTQFTHLLYFDGLGQTDVDEILAVLHSLKHVDAPKCEAAIHGLLDFIEAGCSPEGYFDPERVEEFLISNEELGTHEKSYEVANEAENPIEQLKAKLAD